MLPRLVRTAAGALRWQAAENPGGLSMASYIALLRGINVGDNMLKMEHLRKILADLGFSDAKTYLQSGNVLFSAKRAEDIETILAALDRLRAIPEAQRLEVVRNARLDQLSDEIDVIVYGEFADDQALARFKAHSIYQETSPHSLRARSARQPGCPSP